MSSQQPTSAVEEKPLNVAQSAATDPETPAPNVTIFDLTSQIETQLQDLQQKMDSHNEQLLTSLDNIEKSLDDFVQKSNE